MTPRERSHASIDRFIDALWVEDGLVANTLAAYRRDLQLPMPIAGVTARAGRASTTAARPTSSA